MDRVWLHPTELFARRAAASVPVPRTIARRRVEWPLALLAAIVGSAFTIGALQTAGQLGGRDRTAVQRAAVGTTVSNPDDLVAAEPTARLVADVSPSVVAVTVDGTIRASGVCIRADNIVTTGNAIAGGSQVTVTDMHGRTIPARVAGTDPSTDLALLVVDGANLQVARTGAAGSLLLGQSLVTVAAGSGGQRVANAGIVAAHDVVARSTSGAVLVGLLQTDGAAPSAGGGGAVVDRRGRVIGLSAAGADGEPSGLVVPIEVVESVADQLRMGSVVHQGWLGIVGADASNRDRGGVVVTAVVENSPAAAAGLRVGDLVTDLDGDRLESWSSLLARIRQHPAAEVELVAWRDQERLTMKVQLGQRAVTPATDPVPAPAQTPGAGADSLTAQTATPAAIG